MFFWPVSFLKAICTRCELSITKVAKFDMSIVKHLFDPWSETAKREKVVGYLFWLTSTFCSGCMALSVCKIEDAFFAGDVIGTNFT